MNKKWLVRIVILIAVFCLVVLCFTPLINQLKTVIDSKYHYIIFISLIAIFIIYMVSFILYIRKSENGILKKDKKYESNKN